MGKITEKAVVNTLRDTAHVLVTQQEEQADGTVVESLRRVPQAAFFAANKLLITVQRTEDGTYTANKTYQEMIDAKANGKMLLCWYYDDDVYLVLTEKHGGFTFSSVVHSLLYQVTIHTEDIVSCTVTDLSPSNVSADDIAASVKEYMDQNPVSATCVPGTGAPTTATVGTVGSLWMDTNTGDIYKCIAAADGVYIWVSERTLDHQHYFDITSDGEISLKPSYRGAGSSTHPASVGDGSSLKLPTPLVIPDSVNGIEVTALAPGMFYGNNQVMEITLPATVKTIPEYFCRDAINLREVNSTEHITSIGKAAFMSTRIKKALFPNLTELADGAFVGSAYLEIVDIGKITSIKKQTFANCAFLREVIGGESVDSIGTLAFYYTRCLRDLPLLANVTTVDAYAFFHSRICTSLPESDTVSSKAFPTVDNDTDFWTGVKFTPCRNRIVTKLSQLHPAWKNDYPMMDATIVTYSNACTLFAAMHIHSAITGKYYSDPREFVQELKSSTELSQFLYHDKWPGEFDNVSAFFEAMGYRTSVHGSGDGNDLTNADYQALTNALAQGAYVYTQSALQTNWANDYFDGGHAVVLYGINDLGEVCVLDSSILHEGFRETGFEADSDIYTYTIPYQNIVGPSSNFVIVYPPNVNPDAGADLSGYVKAPATAAAGQVLAVKSVDSSGKPSDWVAVRLSNLGEFDALKKSVSAIDDTIGTGTPLVASAAVGQTVVVKSVDENGVPTEWEAADLPSGGGTQWKLINTITTTEDALARVTCTVDSNGNPFSLTEVYVKAVLPISTTATGSNFFYLNGMYFNGPTAGNKIGYGSLYANGILNQVSSVNGEYEQWHLHGGRGITNAPYITKVELCGQSGGKNIPIGTTLEIYGR